MKPRLGISLGAMLCLAAICRTMPVGGEEAYRLERGRWEPVAARTLAELPDFRPETVKLSKFGGMASGRKLKATGFFRTERVGREWTLVDPEGCPFISVGLCSVNLNTFAEGAASRTFGSDRAWVEATAKLLKTHGFNTLGRWSTGEDFRKLEEPIAYTTALSIMASYAKQRPKYNGPGGFPQQTLPVFDEEFAGYCDEYCRRLEKTRDDPWLLGHFSDNELPFRPEALDNYLKLPPTDPGYRAAAAWLADRHRDSERIAERDRAEFLELVAARYYRTVSEALKRHDPHHLNLGSRLNGRNINDSALRAARFVDVVSIQLYHSWSVNHDRLNRWAELSGRPILNSEWYAMRLDGAEVQIAGAGFRVRSQRDRGSFYQNLCLGMIANPHCVGWHWFKYGGDGENYSKGFVDNNLSPHTPMTSLMKELNAQVYPLKKYLASPEAKSANARSLENGGGSPD
ncbi:MAG: hypothetical protein IT426_18845 [Pirellulales bacterium]|nr:hypothetical protein [Pirellulales bacterium]